MTFVNLQGRERRERFPGYWGHFVHSSNMTFVHWKIVAGSPLPEHSHTHEQVANVLEGQFELTINGETKVVGPGEVAIIPANALHSGCAITDCKIIDVFYPIREDYIGL